MFQRAPLNPNAAARRAPRARDCDTLAVQCFISTSNGVMEYSGLSTKNDKIRDRLLGNHEMAVEILTCGYEGLTIAGFVGRLTTSGTKMVIDVRANPLSRKPGFSKKALAENLKAVGIDYLHEPKVGCPKPIRDRYRDNGDWAAYTRDFLAYIHQQCDAVAGIATIAANKKTCLVCFEADYNFCHRTFVARAIAELRGMPVVHLTDRAPVVELLRSSAA